MPYVQVKPEPKEKACAQEACVEEATAEGFPCHPKPIPPCPPKPVPPAPPCPQLPGTILRIFIPAGAVINLLNLLEITSPSGICLIIRIPLLCGKSVLSGLVDSIKAAGGTVELVPGN